MTSINHIAGIIKILESPFQEVVNDNLSVTRFRGQLPLLRDTQIITVTVWGNLARDVVTHYNLGDYIMIEGYISLRNTDVSNASQLTLKKIELTALKVYPLYSNISDFNSLINYTTDY